MERKRDFVPLEQFLKNNPDVSKHHFPPTRPTPVPHGLLDGFTILVKRVTFDSEKT